MTGTPPTDLGIVRRWIARIRWEQEYDEAMRCRDWQTCEYLMENPPPKLPWLIDRFAYLCSGRWV